MNEVPERDEPAQPDDSLAAQAAAWVPPWARTATPGQPAPDPTLDPTPEPEAPVPPTPEPEPGLDAEPALEADPAIEAGPAIEVEPEALAEPDDLAEPGDLVGVEPELDVEPGIEAATEALAEPEVAEPEVAEPEFAEPGALGAGTAVTGPVVELDEGAPEPADLRPAIEAILLVVDEPVTEQLLAQVLQHPVDAVAAELASLADEYAHARRGFELRRAAGGWRLYTRPEYAAYVERFVLDGQSVRLTQAALETLAVVAYKQPVTRSRISAIRGVNCDGVVRTLVTRGLIEEAGTEPETGAHLYRTSTLFLEKLGLDSVEQLPPLAPFLPDNVEEIAGDAHR